MMKIIFIFVIGRNFLHFIQIRTDVGGRPE